MKKNPEELEKIIDQAANEAVAEGIGQVETPVNPDQPEKGKEPEKGKAWSPGKTLRSILDGSFLTRENLRNTVPYIFFLAFLAAISIANTYYAEKMVRTIDRTKRELKELRYEHITTKSELMHLSKQTEVAKRLIGTGLKETVVPPEKIFVTEDEKDEKAKEERKNYWLPVK